MNLGHVEPIADAILYEGYLLYPYRADALKNRARWTFGVLCPKSQSEAGGGVEPWTLQSECLLLGDPSTVVEAALRFLHPTAREVTPVAPQGTTPAPSLAEQGQEGAAVRIDLGPVRLGALEDGGVRHPFASEGLRHEETLHDTAGLPVALMVRERRRLEGVLEAAATPVGDGVYKLAIRVFNVTPDGDGVLSSFASTHVLLGVRGGEFVSFLDPPEPLREQTESCRQAGAWPVLVGPRGSRDTVLCSPIILEDHPQVAPESPGDLFDGTEIDEILSLRILTLTDEERRQMAATDERARAVLERTEGLGPDQLWRLHGTLRRRPGSEGPRRIRVDGVGLGPGDRVRLRPRGRRDIFDLALAGRRATIVSIEQDYEDRLYFTVTVDDDPGRDLGREGRPGHRFFFDPEEVEPLPASGA